MEPQNHSKVIKRRKKSLKRRIKEELAKRNYSLYIFIVIALIIGIIIGKMVINYTLKAE